MFDETPVVVENAYVVPPNTARMRQRTGVLTAEGQWVPECETHRYGNNLTQPPKVPERTTGTLRGTWIWAGSLHNHFGHFMVESQARIWMAKTGVHYDGIVYVPKRPRHDGKLAAFQSATFRAWGIDAPVEIARAPTRVETLIVPYQSISLGELDDGTPLMRDTVRRNFGKDIRAEGPDRLYVSRSKLDKRAGAILIEPEIEAALAGEGYEIFHPQLNDIETQIARYKAARKIIICDGSAAHLYAYCGHQGQDCAYLRRRATRFEGLVKHIAGFAGRAPLELPLPSREWVGTTDILNRDTSLSLHSMKSLRSELAAHGFVDGRDWIEPDPALIEARVRAYQETGPLTEVQPG